MYGGLGVTFFLLVLFLQEVAGYSALKAGLALMPSTIVMFLLSKRMGRLADRFGPRLFMGLGPLTGGGGLGADAAPGGPRRTTSPICFPRCWCSRSGWPCTVAPLTAAVLSDADESNAGIASGVNNAIARVAGLLGDRGRRRGHLGAVQLRLSTGRLGGRHAVAQPHAPRSRRHAGRRWPAADPARAGPEVAHAVQAASVHAFHVGIGISAALVALGGLLGLAGIRNPRRTVRCADCAGGQLAGQPLEAAHIGRAQPAGPQPATALARRSA